MEREGGQRRSISTIAPKRIHRMSSLLQTTMITFLGPTKRYNEWSKI